MNVAISGASGLVGSALAEALVARGDLVLPLERGAETTEDIIGWDPAGRLDPDDLDRVDALVHLAGESIAGRWSEKKKARILDSRVTGTKTVVDAINACGSPPDVLVCASAVGFYGDRGDEMLAEDSSHGDGFLADVVVAWEAEANRCAVRTVNTRFGIVLSPDGGALGQMLPIFKLGLGGTLGSGTQYMSWVSLRDVVDAILFCIDNRSIEGPVNVVSPNPVTNRSFTKSLGSTLGRPTIFPVPSFALKAALGEAADEMLLVSQRAVPEKIANAGFEFSNPELPGGFQIH